MHLVGHYLYASTRPLPLHETLVDPLLFAGSLLRERNGRQKPDQPAAVLRRIEVFRGHPSSEHDPNGYARSLAQKSQWQRDRRVTVTLRPLKYEYQRDGAGGFDRDVYGKRITVGPPREKGVDVLWALAAVRAAQDPAVDLVIVASSDTDLASALDEIRRLASAKVETCCWWDDQKPARLPAASDRPVPAGVEHPAARIGFPCVHRPDRLPLIPAGRSLETASE